jgi:hypothetical protein
MAVSAAFKSRILVTIDLIPAPQTFPEDYFG